MGLPLCSAAAAIDSTHHLPPTGGYLSGALPLWLRYWLLKGCVIPVSAALVTIWLRARP